LTLSRRKFLSQSAVAGAAVALGGDGLSQSNKQTSASSSVPRAQKLEIAKPKQPVIICRPTNLPNFDEAWKMLKDGADTLAAALHVCKGQEDDPNDQSVGLGGLPNEDGVVELDSCCMHGPTRKAGSAGGVRNIKNVCEVARAVMEHTGHVMLVGEGAERFAVDMGFPRENLLTDKSRRMWLLWKETHSSQDWWEPGRDNPNWEPPASSPLSLEFRRKRLIELAADFGIAPGDRALAAEHVLFPPTGTIHVSAVNEKGEMSGATTTSGTAWKLSGRVGDSPIIGAGCFCDQDVGSAGATGSGEENIKIAGAHTIIENMRRGMSPKEAAIEALQRIVRNYNHDMQRLHYVSMIFYILRKDGQYAGVSLWSHSPSGSPLQFIVHDGTKRLETCSYLLEGGWIDWPSIPTTRGEKY
jgi:N4-(beta-N-acetylglucosaminyl)-L-asparaginase